MSKQKFTKHDLRNGDILVTDAGVVYVFLRGDGYGDGVFFSKTGYRTFAYVRDDLTVGHGPYGSFHAGTFNKVLRYVGNFIDPYTMSVLFVDKDFLQKCTTVVWERKPVRKMTVAEICDALGYEVEIVKEQDDEG